MRRLGSVGLGYGQIFVLIFGFLVTSGLIFLLGIWVGRDLTERRLSQEERIVRMPAPLPPSAREAARERDANLAVAEEPQPERPPHTAGASRAVRAQPATPTPLPVRIGEQPAAPPTPYVPPARAERPAGREEWADAGWTVQVNATTDPKQAIELTLSLKGKGYDAYTVQAPLEGQTWYRVRVGRFASREKAKDLETRLRMIDGLTGAYVTPQ